MANGIAGQAEKKLVRVRFFLTKNVRQKKFDLIVFSSHDLEEKVP